jgi:hypothetical protein
MAEQTNNRSTKRGSRSSSSTAKRTGPRSSRSRSGNSGTAGTRSRSASTSSSRSNRSRSSRSPVARATGTVREGVKSAGGALGDVSKKAKVPALAAGAGLAGLAGGVALAGRNSRKRVLGVPMPTKGGAEAVSRNLAEAAKNVGSFGEGMGSLAAEVRRVRESVAEDANGRSPIEVVLQGLTRRR